MKNLLNLGKYPIDQPESPAFRALVEKCRADLSLDGLFNLPGFLKPEVVETVVQEIAPVIETASFTHSRQHNIYFRDEIPGLSRDHPALRRFETVNHTVCADQIANSKILQIYGFPPLVDFLARTMEKDELHLMADPLAKLNIMSYSAGEVLNWHFDRSEFTTTLLLQAPDTGGDLEYRPELRSDTEPNYDGVVRLLNGTDPEVRRNQMTAGTLNVFRGKNTPHRVTPIVGGQKRIVAVFSYYDTAGYEFSDEERVGFYGRAA